MATGFMNDVDYAELCGKKTVLDLASTFSSAFDRHSSGSYDAIAVGRVIDLKTLNAELSCLQSVLKETEKPFGYLWKTVLHLRKRESAAKKRIKWLKRQVKVQEMLRAKHARGPILPELMSRILSFVPTNHSIIRDTEGGLRVLVYGLLPHAIYTPSLLLPYYAQNFNARWTLEEIARQELKQAVLEDTSLTNQIKLSVINMNISRHITALSLLMRYPHQWKELDICIDRWRYIMDKVVDALMPLLPRLEYLRIVAGSLTTSTYVAPLPESCRRLKTVNVMFHIFSDLSNSGMLDSITSLTIDGIEEIRFPNRDAFKKALKDLPFLLSQFKYLYQLSIWGFDCNRNDLESLPRVSSTSLRFLDVRTDSGDPNIAFLNLFATCRIDCIAVAGGFLQQMEGIFGGAQNVCVEHRIPHILSERKQDGSLAFPEMDQLELCRIEHPPDDIILQLQNRLLEVVRIRYEDPNVRRVRYLRIPGELVTNQQFQDELERYIPFLVLD